MPDRPWYASVSERTQLARWLIDENLIDGTSSEAVLDVIDKPNKYSREYGWYCEAMTIERAALLLRRAS